MSQVDTRDDESQMRDPEEGKTPAAWTAVIIMLVAFVIGTVGVCMLSPLVFWIGVVVMLIGLAVGKIMAMMGLGQYAKGRS